MNRTTDGAVATRERTISLEFTSEQLELVEAGLKLLLVVEDDHEAIHGLKALLEQIHDARLAGR